jgi:hypothetical protein
MTSQKKKRMSKEEEVRVKKKVMMRMSKTKVARQT